MSATLTKPAADDIRNVIVQIRGQPVILDSDLARIYGVPTKVLNQAIKRNRDRFPSDFVFQVDSQEVRRSRSQFVTASEQEDVGLESRLVTRKRGRNIKYLPYAFTEHGAIMAATVLNSPRAVQMSVFVVRAFVKMRALLITQKDLAKKLVELEKTLTERLDLHEHTITGIIQQIMQLLSPPPEPEPPKKEIGFHAR